ncbi:glutamate--tRNA ligase [Bacteroidales bacterium OttesenSCG-928-K03]|nr:glutamate--tRNA ligase [Odoribacter sp. OttesenSCG-928-L07]MDL2239405.1 glutamate--tRNA ligase [Bacteroidales bacterium OttesenSCG-928-L14]MDL2240735.1 glutamate--tRNA ligase [Bacteroidales bacterium OttesenSCG-928-K22]MDL2242925.1 glutamate--tRNA ligase [Bacteroidales bacterium OttesenSCG-928-K03]
MSNTQIRVRFAPSPTGPLHIGGVRTALYNYLFAKKHNGKFLLRIEDTDQTRFVPGAQEYIIESLNWCGIKPDEGVGVGGEFGPYIQSERKEIYQVYVDELLKKGNAYIAFDTAEELEEIRERLQKENNETFLYGSKYRMEMKNSLSMPGHVVNEWLSGGKPYVVRFLMPENEDLVLHDLIRGEVKVNTSTLDDKVLFKSDGMPTYHLANIVDDHLMKISHVIRGEEWLPSMPLHIILYRAFEWEAPQFAHLPLLLKPDGNGKLSKRDGDRLGFPVFPLRWPLNPTEEEIASGYRESGYYPDAFINMLALLGWNPGTEQEIFSLQELVDAFSLDRVSKSGAKFNPDKAKWFNHQYLINKSNEELAAESIPYLHGFENKFDKETLERVCGLIKERLSFIKDIWEQVSFFFEAPAEYDEKIVQKRWKENTADELKVLITILEGINNFSAEECEAKVKEWITNNEINPGNMFNVLRLCLVGAGKGPGVFDIMEIIGKEESISRIERAAEKIIPV